MPQNFVAVVDVVVVGEVAMGADAERVALRPRLNGVAPRMEATTAAEHLAANSE